MSTSNRVAPVLDMSAEDWEKLRAVAEFMNVNVHNLAASIIVHWITNKSEDIRNELDIYEEVV